MVKRISRSNDPIDHRFMKIFKVYKANLNEQISLQMHDESNISDQSVVNSFRDEKDLQ